MFLGEEERGGEVFWEVCISIEGAFLWWCDDGVPGT